MKKTIITLYCGGTISSKPNKKGVREASEVDLITNLRKNKSEFSDLENKITIKDPVTIYTGLSENISHSIQNDIIKKVTSHIENNQNVGVLMTFGTDSIISMSKAIHNSLNNKVTEKNIIFVITGANEDTTVDNSDAWENLLLSFKTLNTNKSGIYICFSNKVIPANNIERMPFDGDSMKLGNNSEILFWQEMHKSQLTVNKTIKSILSEKYGVELYAVNDPSIQSHEKLLSEIERLRIIIFVLYHSGTANATDSDVSVSKLIEKLRKKNPNVICFGASENGESVTLDNYEPTVSLRKVGLVPLYNMHYLVALVKASGLISIDNNITIIEQMLCNFSGEISEELINKSHINTLKNIYK